MLIDNLFFIENIENSGTAADIVIRLNPNCEIYRGHFPSTPITPGVCLVQLVVELLERCLNKSTQIIKAKSIKFTGLLKPNEFLTVNCHLEWSSCDNRHQIQASVFYEKNIFAKINMELGERV